MKSIFFLINIGFDLVFIFCWTSKPNISYDINNFIHLSCTLVLNYIHIASDTHYCSGLNKTCIKYIVYTLYTQ